MSDQLRYYAQLAARGRMNRRHFLGRAGAIGMTAATANLAFSSAVMAQGPVAGGKIRVGIQGGSTTDALDPAVAANSTMAQVLRLWSEPLVELTADGGLEPRLAEEYSSNEDGSVWSFKIRKGVTFSNGQSMTPEDVKATIERHATEGSVSGAFGLLRDISTLSVEGDMFVITLSGPNADLPYLLTDYHLMIQPNGGKDDPNAAIGTGPYVLKDHQKGVQYTFEKNPDYWDSEMGHAATIELIVINDDNARITALQSKDVDMINRVPPKVAHLVQRQPGVTLQAEPSAGHYVFIMHCNTAPFDNKDLRLALKYAMNREEMVEKILFGYGSLGNDSPINASYPLFSDDLEQRNYDPDKAAAFYKASGHSGPILLRTSDNSFPGAPDAAALFQASAKSAGIELELKREPNDGYWSDVWNSKPFCTSYWGGRATQDAMYSTAYLSTADWNDTRFFNESFDNMVIAARRELDSAKRKAIYRDLSLMVSEEGGLICPMFNDFVDATSDRVAGWGPSKGFDLMNFYAPMKMWAVG